MGFFAMGLIVNKIDLYNFNTGVFLLAAFLNKAILA